MCAWWWWWWGLIKLPFIPSKCHSYHHASTFWIRQNACMFWANQSAGISIISIFIRQIVSIVMLQCTFLPLVLKSLLQYMCAVISMASFTQIDCDTFSQNHLCFRWVQRPPAAGGIQSVWRHETKETHNSRDHQLPTPCHHGKCTGRKRITLCI